MLHADPRRPTRRPRTPRSSTTTSSSGSRRTTRRHARSASVTAVVHGAAQDLLAIRTPDGRDALVPFVAALVPEVDVAAGRVVVADRPGPGRRPLPEDE